MDREFVAAFMIFDEMADNPAGRFYSINNFIFGNLPGLYMKQGEKVRWHLLGTGNEIDLHSPHWYGETVVEGTRHTDVIEPLPGSMKTVDMVADNPGTWMFHCHVEDHMEAGMVAVYTIYPPQSRVCPVSFPEGEPQQIVSNGKEPWPQADCPDRDHVGDLLAPQDLRRPSSFEWSSTSVIPPEQDQTIEKPGIPARSSQSILGWVFFPSFVKYADGTEWFPQAERECFKIIWRNSDQLDVPALPPRRFEINSG